MFDLWRAARSEVRKLEEIHEQKVRKLENIHEQKIPRTAKLGLVQFGSPQNFSRPIISKLDNM